jgi:hypothetical protein
MCRKGFKEAPGAGGDHRRLGYVSPQGDIIFYTCVSHGGSKDLSNKLISDMADDCHLSRKEFLAFAKCWMSAETYRQILIDKGVISDPE